MHIRLPLATLLACSLLPAAADAAPATGEPAAAAPALTFHALRRDPAKRTGESLKPVLTRDDGLPPVIVEVVAHYGPNGQVELRCDGGHPAHAAPVGAEREEAAR